MGALKHRDDQITSEENMEREGMLSEEAHGWERDRAILEALVAK